MDQISHDMTKTTADSNWPFIIDKRFVYTCFSVVQYVKLTIAVGNKKCISID